MHTRAGEVLAAYAKAAGSTTTPAVVPVGDLTGQVGDWEPSVGDNNKRALMAGQVYTERELLAGIADSMEVRWADGTTVRVPVLGPQEALVAIEQSVGADARMSCGNCAPLIAVAATLTDAPIVTTRGQATGPIWSFAIRGTSVRVTRVALANPIVVPQRPDNPGGAVGIDAASGATAGNELTVTFTGAPDPGDRPCGEDYTAEAVESGLAVTVIVTRHPYPGYPGACTAVGAPRSATAALAKPLGDRVVLDLASGQPVTTTRQP